MHMLRGRREHILCGRDVTGGQQEVNSQSVTSCQQLQPSSQELRAISCQSRHTSLLSPPSSLTQRQGERLRCVPGVGRRGQQGEQLPPPQTPSPPHQYIMCHKEETRSDHRQTPCHSSANKNKVEAKLRQAYDGTET